MKHKHKKNKRNKRLANMGEEPQPCSQWTQRKIEPIVTPFWLPSTEQGKNLVAKVPVFPRTWCTHACTRSPERKADRQKEGVLSYLSCCWDKRTNKFILRKEKFFALRVQGYDQSWPGRCDWRSLKYLATQYPRSGSREQRGLALNSFLLCVQSRASAHRVALPTFRVSLSISVNQIYKLSHRHAPVFVSNSKSHPAVNQDLARQLHSLSTWHPNISLWSHNRAPLVNTNHHLGCQEWPAVTEPRRKAPVGTRRSARVLCSEVSKTFQGAEWSPTKVLKSLL